MTDTRVVGLHRLLRPAKARSKHAGDVLEGEPPLAVEDGEVVGKALGVRGLSRHEPMAKPRPHGRFYSRFRSLLNLGPRFPAVTLRPPFKPVRKRL